MIYRIGQVDCLFNQDTKIINPKNLLKLLFKLFKLEMIFEQNNFFRNLKFYFLQNLCCQKNLKNPKLYQPVAKRKENNKNNKEII